MIDLVALARAAPGKRPVWTPDSEDLNVNLIALRAGDSIAAHVNTEVDVLIVGVDGDGVVEMNGQRHALSAGKALLIPKGVRRALRAPSRPCAYLTCHRRRSGLLPTRSH